MDVHRVPMCDSLVSRDKSTRVVLYLVIYSTSPSRVSAICCSSMCCAECTALHCDVCLSCCLRSTPCGWLSSARTSSNFFAEQIDKEHFVIYIFLLQCHDFVWAKP